VLDEQLRRGAAQRVGAGAGDARVAERDHGQNLFSVSDSG
jgi:hypothetical protein